MPRPASLSLELLHTFARLVQNEGDAALTARQLSINQPSMSKRLKYFQHTSKVLPLPWLVLEGKTWKLTEEGRKMLPAVHELIRRYERMIGFVHDLHPPEVKFACGQEAAAGLVLRAIQIFREKNPTTQLRVATLRGQARIVGVSSGSLDLATVTASTGAIRKVARRPLHLETITHDELALVCIEPLAEALHLKKRARVQPEDFVGVPLILPSPEAGVRKDLDRALEKAGVLRDLNLVLEVGGWPTIRAYVGAGLGVGLLSTAALADEDFETLHIRRLDAQWFRPIETKLICRLVLGAGDKPDLSAEAQAFHDALLRASREHRRRAR